MSILRHISVALPEQILTNDDLALEHPSWDMNAVASKAGVYSRRIVTTGETAFDLAVRACETLLRETGLQLQDIDGIVFCTQSPDYIMPSNAHLLHRKLELHDRVLAFDFNLACSGYIYGLAMADSFVKSKLASNILLVTAETYSKYINPKDRSARVLFGDGAAVSLISSEGDGLGTISGAELCSHGKDFEKFYIPAGGMRLPCSAETKEETTDQNGNTRSSENIQMDGLGVWSFINSAVPKHLRNFLADRFMSIEDVDLFVFHQASKMTLDSLMKVLGIPPEKAFIAMEETGNLVSASIPFALRTAQDQGRIVDGMKIVLCGFGVGFSYGTILLEPGCSDEHEEHGHSH